MNYSHRWRILMPVCLVTVGLWTAQPAAAQKLLRWKLESVSLDYQIEQQIQQELRPANTPPMKFNTSQTMTMKWDVKSVTDDGTMTIEQVVDTFRMRMQSPQGIMMEYDSTSDEKPTGLATMIGPMLESFVNRPMLTVYTPRGQVKEMKLPKGFLDKVNQLAGGGQFGNLFSDDWMKQFSEMGVLPEGPVTPGQSWQTESTLKNPILGQMKIVTSSRYEGTEVRDGRSLEKIALTIQFQADDEAQDAAEADPPGESPAKAGQDAEKQQGIVGIREQSGEGMLYFDAEAGLLYESQSRTKMKMSIDILGQKMEQDMVMEMTMTLQEPDPSSADSTSSSQP